MHYTPLEDQRLMCGMYDKKDRKKTSNITENAPHWWRHKVPYICYVYHVSKFRNNIAAMKSAVQYVCRNQEWKVRMLVWHLLSQTIWCVRSTWYMWRYWRLILRAVHTDTWLYFGLTALLVMLGKWVFVVQDTEQLKTYSTTVNIYEKKLPFCIG